jgi:tight adherence protein B
MPMNTILFVVLAMVAVGGIFYVFVYPILSGEAQAEKRQKALSSATLVKRPGDRTVDANARRKQITDSLKEIEDKGKAKKKTLDQKIAQAGLSWSKQQFYMISAALGVATGFALFFVTGNIVYAAPGAMIGAFGLPNWILGYLAKRRVAKFLIEFPNAVDVIIRGIKAGLPLGDCLRIIANEASEPVKTEFRLIVETQSLGLSLGESIERIVERVPTPEANFFSIVINIQQKAGGNLSEALANLSRVLRERKKMQIKIKAMSAEAKASAGIIAALPFIVATLVYLSSPKYIELLWITSTGRMVMAVCAFWMFIGVMSMKKMIAFDM